MRSKIPQVRAIPSPEDLWGYVASQPELNREVLKRALFYGGVMGSFAVESFGTERLQSLTRDEIDARFQVFRELTHLGMKPRPRPAKPRADIEIVRLVWLAIFISIFFFSLI